MVKLNFKSKKIKIIIIVSIVSMLAVGAYYLMQSETVEVDTVIVERIDGIIKETGTVKSQSMVDLLAYGYGKVMSIDVTIGQHVKKGDVLGKIDDQTLQFQLESLSYDVQALQTNIEYLTSPYTELTLDSYAESARIARENYNQAKRDYDNARILYESGAISKSELESFELLFNVNKMSYMIALNEADSATGSSDTNVSQFSYQLKSLEVQLENVKNEIERYTLIAPFDGVISDIYLKENSFALATAPVIQIYAEEYYIEANLLEEDLVQLTEGTPVNIIINDESIPGMISMIYPTIRSTVSDLGVSQLKGTVEIRADHDFKIVGREVDLEFVIETNESATTINKESIVKYNGDNYVYMIDGNKAKMKEVTIGIKGFDRYEVVEGLVKDDIVIINPSDTIKEGLKVKY